MVTKAQQEAVNRYLSKTFDDIKIRVPKGQREEYKTKVADLGYTSFNGFVIEAIREKIDRESRTETSPG